MSIRPDVLLFILCFWFCFCLYLLYRGIKTKNKWMAIASVLGLLAAVTVVVWAIDIYPAYVE
jgi:hypothetical protein